MKKTLILSLLLILAISAFVSCSKNNDAPEGLQLVRENTEDGYKFYGPDGWAIINDGKISATKVSTVNNTSITFTEANPPVATIPEYFTNSLLEFPDSFKESLQVKLRDEKCKFGNANGEAYKYIYTYKYQNYDFACMQILLTHDDRFFIFTYTSYGDVSDENSTYRSYLELVQKSIDSFLFTSKGKEAEPKVYGTDSDGYLLVSDRKISGFDLYLPDSYKVIYSDAYVKAKISEGANISLSKATSSGVSISTYWDIRKEELSLFVNDIETISENLVNKDGNITLVFGDIDPYKIASYEYKYSFGGNVYHVYQVMGVDSFSGYVFTYTALEDEYTQHIDEIKRILEKVRF